jgi:4'-phosphopantetheinyl transferase
MNSGMEFGMEFGMNSGMELLRPEWKIPVDRLVLLEPEIHLWRAALTVEPAQLEELTLLLSPDELARSQRFRFPQHQRRFAAGRGILRTILGRYLDLPPERLGFHYSPTGKPSLSPSLAPRLEFNLSHSQDLMLCAVSRSPVGVDLEQLRPLTDLEPLTQRFFATEESQQICALPIAARSQAFFQYWTGKEAILKAAGTGLADLATVELRWIQGTLQPLGAVAQTVWTLHTFVPEQGFIGAIAGARSGEQPGVLQTSFWQWSAA